MPLKRLRSPNSTSDKTDKSVKIDKRVRCKESVVDDYIACEWCSDWEYISCANISHKDLEILKGEYSLFCSHCLPTVSDALTLFQTYYMLDSEFEVKFQSMENQIHKGINQNIVRQKVTSFS